jgi:CRP-like cAMP-binding protein
MEIVEAQQEPSVAEGLIHAMERPLDPPSPPFDLAARVLVLRAAVPFAREHASSLFQVARQAAEIRADRGLELWRRGDASEHFLLVVSGSVRVRTSSRGELVAGPGSVLGAFDALAAQPRWFTALADEPLLALSLPIEPVLDVLEDEPLLARATLAALARALCFCRRARRR